ncbi:general secretion pathway protein GspN [Pseudomonas ovata]|uniref:general secretion pathway protein GspN n=1 Tax=Pseudomonas ovata TaxID=1839709 RepID=UPI000D6959CD|nr:general secretion pathway protein GspN [Pseudomonas ovata]
MSRRLWLAGGLVFGLTLLLNLPAAWALRLIDWPPGWQPAQVSGSVWNGHAQQAGALGPLAWQLRPWRARLETGLAQQHWTLTVSGWPWHWQAQLLPGAAVAGVNSPYLIGGQWQGRLQIDGRGARCVGASGQVQGHDVGLLTPWTLAVGEVRLNVECQQGLQGLADVQREGEHHLQARLETDGGGIRVSGQVTPQAALTPLLVQAGLLKAGDERFEKVFGAVRR